ncbi:hypothetical protein [Streptomyces cylindrosporus]|uniref:Uncharacterized protein n=1 Tax=Streptomyces cylindrosporus TaxID=2927583 RepID=A0ABS9YK49_9ACTN|nr:hypothetical protein [Streptomyces cylindrosporus]MCI3277632.1 hypothetical protein [Streptomyces cylindrosporus]
MSTPAPCLGVCNTAWRRAEHDHATTGTPHDIPVTWGTPVHCQACVDRARRHLAELPELLVAISLEPLHGTRGPTSATTNSAPTDTTPWPGQAARLLTDLIAGGLAETAADVRRLRGLGDHPTRQPGVREGEWINTTVRLLVAHVDWLLQEHPCATESHDPVRQGRDLIPSGNPAAQIAHWHRAATRFTRRDHAPEAKRFAPCKRCGGPWLAESADLRLVDDQPYIECQDPDCRALFTHAEYARYVKDLAAQETAARRAPVHPDGAQAEAVA